MTVQSGNQTLTIGSKLPHFSLPGADGQTYATDSYRDTPILVIIFLANHCPYVGSWEDRMIAIANEYRSQGVQLLGISSNDTAKYPQDGPDEMRKRAEEAGYPFPYLFDEDGAVARSFGGTRTPEVFVFDDARELRYHGAIDSDYEESAGTEHYLRIALKDLIRGQTIQLPETPPLGCKIITKQA